VVLGAWVYPPSDPSQSLATLSQEAFKGLINPTLSKAYTGAGGNSAFVDVTAATDGYGTLPGPLVSSPYGKIPKPVDEVCELTYYCSLGNIHANTKGYDLIGALVEKQYLSMKS